MNLCRVKEVSLLMKQYDFFEVICRIRKICSQHYCGSCPIHTLCLNSTPPDRLDVEEILKQVDEIMQAANDKEITNGYS